MEKRELTITERDVKRLVSMFARMPCVLSDPDLTPEQQVAYEKELAWEDADRERDKAIFNACVIELQRGVAAESTRANLKVAQ